MSDNHNEQHDHKKVWNEDLILGLQARHQQAWQQQRKAQYQWRQGAQEVEKIRKDIRITKNGSKIYNLDASKLTKTVYEECVRMIRGQAPILPPGFVPMSAAEQQKLEETTMMPYIQQLSRESGAYAILLAFHGQRGGGILTKQQICRLAQPHCRTEMEANYHAGRMFGAWKAKDTLVRHGLITEHKAGVSYTPRGFRSNGYNSYSLTPDGQRAIQQMFKKWPDLEATMGSGANDNNNFDDVSDAGFSFGGVATAAQHVHRRIPTTAAPKRPGNERTKQDEEELRSWIQTAQVGQQKGLKGIGKDRRRRLHKLCDQLQQQYPGLQLHHESQYQGMSNKRDLYITLRAKPSHMNLQGLGGVISAPAVATSAVTPSPARKRPLTSISGGQTLGGSCDGSRTKKPRSAAKAAASAALARFENHQQQQKSAKKRRPTTIDLSGGRAGSPPVNRFLVLPSDDEEDDRKPAATVYQTQQHPSPVSTGGIAVSSGGDDSLFLDGQTRPHNPHDYRIDDHCILKSDGQQCLILQVHCSGHLTVVHPDGADQKVSVREVDPCPEAVAAYHAYKEREQESSMVKPSALKNPSSPVTSKANPPTLPKSDDAVVDLCSDTEEDAIGGSSQLTILIDDRERSRNHKPRELRMGLTNEIESGSLSQLWGKRTCAAGPSVQERKLHYGDFAFELDDGRKSGRLSAVIERKTVADLVQRSAYGDHWKQLSRMRDTCQHAILLIEGDHMVASRFDAYGSQSLERRPGHHTIETPADIFLFMGRAILSSRKITFFQVQDAKRTFQGVAAIGRMAEESDHVGRNVLVNPPNISVTQQRLSDHLASGGIHWRVAKEVASQFGSTQSLQSAYDGCDSVFSKQALMEPIIGNMLGEVNSEFQGSPMDWSVAIYEVLFTDQETRKAKCASYQDIHKTIGQSLCDPARLLRNLYKHSTPDAALDAAMNDTQNPDIGEQDERTVAINISSSFGPCFDTPKQCSFYSLSVNCDDNPWSLPYCIISTSTRWFHSDRLIVSLLEGARALSEASRYLEGRPSCLVEKAKALAAQWSGLCFGNQDSNVNMVDRHVLLVRGVGSAISIASKTPSYQQHAPLLIDLAWASLMLDHNVVVVQAVRKKQEETTMIMRQLALACYHYQLLPHTNPHPTFSRDAQFVS